MTTPFPNQVRAIAASNYLASAEFEALRRSDDAAAFEGLAGELVAMILPHSEADPFALLLQFLTAFGNAIGRCAYQVAEADRHYANLFAVLVGDTSKSRKGSSLSQVLRVMQEVDHDWFNRCRFAGLSTGEGLIHHVRDGHDGDGKNQDPGVTDKRALVVASELAAVLASMQRTGNTLSSTIRDAWDRGDLRTLTKGAPERATGAHISIIAHITREELRRQLNATEMANGFANRFLWARVRRSKSLPEGGALSDDEIQAFAVRVRESMALARRQQEIGRDDEARIYWRTIYDELSEGAPGLFGAVTSRAEAQVMRLSGIYAVLDQSPVIRRNHLVSALALWRYCEASARAIFGDATGDRIADRILAFVVAAGDTGVSRSDVSNHFTRNVNAGRITMAIESLVESKHLETRQEPTGGRNATRLFCGTKETR